MIFYLYGFSYKTGTQATSADLDSLHCTGLFITAA